MVVVDTNSIKIRYSKSCSYNKLDNTEYNYIRATQLTSLGGIQGLDTLASFVSVFGYCLCYFPAVHPGCKIILITVNILYLLSVGTILVYHNEICARVMHNHRKWQNVYLPCDRLVCVAKQNCSWFQIATKIYASELLFDDNSPIHKFIISLSKI